MTNETKERILSVVFLPITGFNYLLKECKNDNYQNFFVEWFWYLMSLTLWGGCIAVIGISIWGLIYHFNAMIIPVSIVVGGIFVLFILPTIIHKHINRK